MGFASSWLEKSALFPQFISEEPDLKTGIIIVVPAYNEPDLTVLLDSLLQCQPPRCMTEVLIVINAPPGAPGEYVSNNKKSVEQIHDWKEKKKPFFRLYCFETSPLEGWGVGMARKSGMDEALRRFDHIGNTEGVILSVDADCTVEENYLRSVETELLNKKNRTACSLYFEHRTTDFEPNDEIINYELHLRYYVLGLKYCGFPYPFHTVGSSMAVKALSYLKAGGMNRKQAGEDFYFIQKLVGSGGYFSLTGTTVYPSSRKSFRVPFGTGATMEKLSRPGGGQLLTYNVEAFIQLKSLFEKIDSLFCHSNDEIMGTFGGMPEGIKNYLAEKEFVKKIEEINGNTATLESFRKRFFMWFNMFRIIKFMNHIHSDYLEKKPVAESVNDLLALYGKKIVSDDPVGLLRYFRAMEKNG